MLKDTLILKKLLLQIFNEIDQVSNFDWIDLFTRFNPHPHWKEIFVSKLFLPIFENQTQYQYITWLSRFLCGVYGGHRLCLI